MPTEIFVSRTDASTVAWLREAVKLKCANKLEKIDADDLKVYQNQDDASQGESKAIKRLSEKLSAHLDWGSDEDNPMVVVAPASGKFSLTEPFCFRHVAVLSFFVIRCGWEPRAHDHRSNTH
jgi:hypothetical protein